MQQVAFPQSPVSGSSAKRQLTACLRLSRGASSQATWLLEDVPGGTTIQVGADATCDWQIRAACVPEHALTAMMIGGTLFMKSAQAGGVLLDGKPLPLQWTEVFSGARVDIGLSRIDIALGEASSAFERLPQAYVPAIDTTPELPLSARVSARAPEGTLRHEPRRHDGARPESNAASATGRPSSVYADITPPQEQLRESIVSRPAGQPRDSQLPDSGRPSLVDRLTRPSMLDGAPSLLDDRMSEAAGPALWKFAMGGLVTAVAYAGWLVLLDHL